MEVPISTSVQEAYRQAMQIPDAPAFIDTKVPITPVAIIAQASTEGTSQFFKLTDGTDTASITSLGYLDVETHSDNSKWNAVSTEVTTTGDVTVGTVPASKRWRILAWSLSMASNAVCRLKLNTITVDICDTTGHISKVLQEPLILTAGQTIVRNFSTSATGAVSVIYEEESV